jgi:anti-sigma factor RsiW
MTCNELRDRLDAYTRGTLSAADATALEAHLETCAACEALLAQAEPQPAGTQALPRRWSRQAISGRTFMRLTPRGGAWPRRCLAGCSPLRRC